MQRRLLCVTLGAATAWLAACSSSSNSSTPGNPTSSAGAAGAGVAGSAGDMGTSGSGGSSAGSGGSSADSGGSSAGSTSTAGASAGGSAGAAGGAGAAGSAGAGGSAGTAGTAGVAGSAGAAGAAGGIDQCGQPPAGSAADAVTALNAVNTARVAMGVKCMVMVPTLNQSSQAHCDYYAANNGNATCEGGSISAHNEVNNAACTGYTGVSPGDREKAAGYTGNSWSEVMAFDNDPAQSVAQWINTVWHRTPLLSPWYDDMGYGTAPNCDVIDQGRGAQSAATVTAFYPYANQTGVPRLFRGNQEGPTPPAPPTGWPSGSPITLYVRNATTVSHTIEVDGSGTPLGHTWIDYNQSDNDNQQLILYTDAPFTANTTYHVNIVVTIGGTMTPFDWKFTTGAT